MLSFLIFSITMYVFLKFAYQSKQNVFKRFFFIKMQYL